MSPLFRRESLHEKLAREGGLNEEPPPHDTRPRWGETGIHGVPRPRSWDAVVTVTDPGAAIGDSLRFVSLPGGSLLLEEGADDVNLEPFADAVETEVEPPYRAEAVRHDSDQWAVAARRIAVVELPSELAGDEVTLTARDGERTLEIDGERSFGTVPILDSIGRERGESYVVRASRLDGPLWEVTAAAL